MEFFALGQQHDERCFMAANRVGKTESAGGYEVAMHLTGLYPDWWPGFRFGRPVDVWAAGKTAQTVRDILVTALLGPHEERGTGLIPGDCIARVNPSSGLPNSVDSVLVHHVSGAISTLGFKSYDQGRQSFEGTRKDVVWLDEEPPFDVYGEAITRTMSTVPGRRGGLVICTFTPLLGLSATALYFLPHLAPETADEEMA